MTKNDILDRADTLRCNDQFEGEILPAEKSAIAARRRAVAERRPVLERTDLEEDGCIGLSLSGGGIRSASFSLGVVQALDTKDGIDCIDYLSTVSGGGYTGCCLTACMTQSGGKVPFNQQNGFGDTDAVHHIRDFSNYLMPRGFRDLVSSFGLIGRGLAANGILLAPVFLLSTLVLLLARPNCQRLPGPGPIQWFIERAERDHHIPILAGFPDTIFLIYLTAVWQGIWAMKRSLDAAFARSGTSTKSTEFHGPFVRVWKILLGFIVLLAWLELQPLVLRAIASTGPCGSVSRTIDWHARVAAAANTWFSITPYLAPVGAIVAFMSRNLVLVNATRKGLRATAGIKRILAKALLWCAALVIPSLIWYLYLRFTLALMPASTTTFVWLTALFLGFSIAAFFIDPNATSLHRLYRDRLSKAFLFDADPARRLSGKDLTEISPKLHEIDKTACPYPIINAALNLEGSAFANRRGRNADFFEFTPLFSGSEATRWIASKTLGDCEPNLDLGTAMAVSGAAFSPNMGSATIKPLVPTLALLNMRLGFWLRNPLFATQPRPWWRRLVERRCFLLLREMFSRIDEKSWTIYVTDGGNIENLGVHALLKRRCKLVIVVDAEADPAMTFGAYLKLQRYARIDLGVLLDLPWQPIRDAALALDARIASDQRTPTPLASGTHVAVGSIRYGAEKIGTLIYVKASLTGDESDYILDYKTRNPEFPHETTGDQFFGEEQLEVYRALGFHIMRNFLDGVAPFEVTPHHGETVRDARIRVMREIRQHLGIAVSKA